MNDARKFPILGDGKRVGYISWEVAELLRPQAERNHGQSLETLASRGGLSWFEAACALAKSGLYKGIKPTARDAQIMLSGAAHALDRLKERKS